MRPRGCVRQSVCLSVGLSVCHAFVISFRKKTKDFSLSLSLHSGMNLRRIGRLPAPENEDIWRSDFKMKSLEHCDQTTPSHPVNLRGKARFWATEQCTHILVIAFLLATDSSAPSTACGRA